MCVGIGRPVSEKGTQAEIASFFENRAKRAVRLAKRAENAGKLELAQAWRTAEKRYRFWLSWLNAEHPHEEKT